jgi:hypothetical protein
MQFSNFSNVLPDRLAYLDAEGRKMKRIFIKWGMAMCISFIWLKTTHGAHQSSMHVRHAINIPCSESVTDILHLLLLPLPLKKRKRIHLCDVIENILLFMKMFIVHMTMW